MSIETPNLALSTANTLTDRKAYDIASWLYDIASWLHMQGDQGRPPKAQARYEWEEKEDRERYNIWRKTPPGIMYLLQRHVENVIENHSDPRPFYETIGYLSTFEESMAACLQEAIKELKECPDGGGAECQKLIERGKFFFSFWMPEPVAAAIVKIRGGAVEKSEAAGKTLTPTASTSPRLTP